MSDINAAIGIVQLEKLDEMNKKRELRWRLYNSILAREQGAVELPVIKDYVAKHSYHNYVIKVDDRDDLHDYLASQGIDTSVHYRPNNHYDVFSHRPTPVAEEVWQRILTLPLYPDLEESQVVYICDRIHLWLLMKSQADRIKV
jgi:perosamine synthetase